GGGAVAGHRARLLLRDEGAGGFRVAAEGREGGGEAALVRLGGGSRDGAGPAADPRAVAGALPWPHERGRDGVDGDDGGPRAVRRHRAGGVAVPEPRYEEEGAGRAGLRVLPQGGAGGDGGVPGPPEGIRLPQRDAWR